MSKHRLTSVLLGIAVLATPVCSLAQQHAKVWRVGVLSPRQSPDSLESDFRELPRGLRELGYVEGKNLRTDWRFADGNYDRLADLAAELVRLRVDVIITAGGTPAALAAQKATKTIPIVFIAVGDPVGSGLVKTLARPGGNITGLSVLSGDTTIKQVEMLKSLVPKLSRVAYLRNPTNSASLEILKRIGATEIGNVHVASVEATTPSQIEGVFTAMNFDRPGALLVSQDSFLFQQRHQIAELAGKIRLPSMGAFREYVEAGGLMSYGPNRAYAFRRAATYIDKILNGANPGELPVEQPTKFELVLNRKTAKALGIEFPPEILLLADKVID